jgi:hypothetical protein
VVTDREAEIAASVAALQDLGSGYDHALAEGLVERIGAEIDQKIAAGLGDRVAAEVDRRIVTQLDEYAAGCRHQRRRAKGMIKGERRLIRAERRTIRANRADRSGWQPIALGLGSMLLALWVTSIVLDASAGFGGVMLTALIWIIIGVVNLGYAVVKRPQP